MLRESAYDQVQSKTKKAWEEKKPLINLIKEDKKITGLLSEKEIEDCFDHQYHLKNVDFIFKRLGL